MTEKKRIVRESKLRLSDLDLLIKQMAEQKKELDRALGQIVGRLLIEEVQNTNPEQREQPNRERQACIEQSRQVSREIRKLEESKKEMYRALTDLESCPNCGSINIRLTETAGSFGIRSILLDCRYCGYDWRRRFWEFY